MLKLLDWIDPNKIDWQELSAHPNAIHLLEQNLNKIDKKIEQKNKKIITTDSHNNASQASNADNIYFDTNIFNTLQTENNRLSNVTTGNNLENGNDFVKSSSNIPCFNFQPSPKNESSINNPNNDSCIKIVSNCNSNKE
jgi:hypothetical protein